ncbi:MerR family transcriptional regulator [Desulfitobacterium chlororespirans]|uniref:Transcriptional regulator, MerR family n=1 Tax=Desulfitobacterium chlororespirans DSM 11544 TaxID=1121395 RepID=A0A1M7V058_9FIRM|nr:MerR family transcriptional regulator [Desulfitobacterium chlororespirans]SHN88608.1 transcriptional regulator, MerR family [Desulfitobacterium chlororespirans DSM 11544]
MFKIGEFSKLTQVSIRMLRYYDETGLLKPAEIDKFTNYRLYSAKQISLLNKILFLRDLGFNVSEIGVALDRWNDGFITNLLDNKRLDIENTIKSAQDKLSKIELAKRDIRQEKIAIHYNVSIKSIPSYQVFSLRRIVSDYYAEGLLWKEMSAFANENDIPILDNTFTIYHDTDYREKNVDIEVCAPVARMGKDMNAFTYRNIEPVPIMACTMVCGPFENIAGAYLSLAEWLGEHSQYRMTGQSRQIVHRGPWNEETPDKYLTEIQIPLIKI